MSENTNPIDLTRREFMGKGALAVAGVVAAPAIVSTVVQATEESTGVSSKKRWGMLIDAGKCAEGCTDCVTACNKENGIDLMTKPEADTDQAWEMQRPQWIRKVKLKDTQTEAITNLPMLCQHCENPPCVDVCPTTASFKRADGIVMVDRHDCIGCRYCMLACPYKARSFIHQHVAEQVAAAPRGVGCVESCTLCVHRIDKGQTTTACQDACSQAGHNAIMFGDLNDANGVLAQTLKTQSSRQIREDLELNTGVRYSNI